MFSHAVLVQIEKSPNSRYIIPNPYNQALGNNFAIPKTIFKKQNLSLIRNVLYQIDLMELVLHSLV